MIPVFQTGVGDFCLRKITFIYEKFAQWANKEFNKCTTFYDNEAQQNQMCHFQGAVSYSE